jgi:hypothetical protein
MSRGWPAPAAPDSSCPGSACERKISAVPAEDSEKNQLFAGKLNWLIALLIDLLVRPFGRICPASARR